MTAGLAAPIALRQEGKAHGTARPKIAALVTEYRKWSHGQHIVDRFLDGYGWESGHHHPRVDVVSLYVDHAAQGGPEPRASRAAPRA